MLWQHKLVFLCGVATALEWVLPSELVSVLRSLPCQPASRVIYDVARGLEAYV